MNINNLFDLTSIQWITVITAAFMVGLSKTGINGVMMLIIPILAGVFGGRESTGILLPMLVIGDLFAVLFYRKHADWGNVRKLLPWALAGLILGLPAGNYLNDSQFKALIAVIVIICLGLLLYMDRRGSTSSIPQSPWVSALAGVGAGFATMVGNAAGPIFSVYLLAKGFGKYDFMGTAAWFFLIINLSKVPLQVFVWHNVDAKTFLLAGLLLPVLSLGAAAGIFIIKRLNEKYFRYIILGMTAVSAFRLFF